MTEKPFLYWEHTAQEVFDYVTEKLFEQKVPSLSNNRCRYRGPNGTKCAAGHLIPDEKYRESFEGMGWDRLEYMVHPVSIHHELIYSLQRCHDEASIFPDSYLKHLNRLFNATANRLGLTYAPRITE